jgi:hypothetical protein
MVTVNSLAIILAKQPHQKERHYGRTIKKQGVAFIKNWNYTGVPD